MGTARYVYLCDSDHWLGYFEEFPDYLTQRENLEDLQKHLRDLFWRFDQRYSSLTLASSSQHESRSLRRRDRQGAV